MVLDCFRLVAVAGRHAIQLWSMILCVWHSLLGASGMLHFGSRPWRSGAVENETCAVRWDWHGFIHKMSIRRANLY